MIMLKLRDNVSLSLRRVFFRLLWYQRPTATAATSVGEERLSPKKSTSMLIMHRDSNNMQRAFVLRVAPLSEGNMGEDSKMVYFF